MASDDERPALEDDYDEPKKGKNGKRSRDIEEEEEEDEDDIFEEDEEEEEDDRGKSKKRRKSRRNQYIDDLADVDDEDEEEEEEEDGLGGPEDDFIDRNEIPEAGQSSRRNLLRDIGGDDDFEMDAGHRGLDMSRQAREDADLGQIAADFRERYGRQSRAAARDMGEHIPKNMLMPSVDDPSIWAVRCKPGREKELVSAIFRKCEALYRTPQALRIISVFFRDSLKGYIYVEARLETDVRDAVQGFVGVYRTEFRMVPIEEMPDLLRTKKRETPIVNGSWVRIKRGKYAGDLAQVNEIMENADDVGLRFVPRIDLNPKEEGMQVGPDGKKRKKGSTTSGGLAFRPPQKFFNAEEVKKAYKAADVSRTKNGGYMFRGDFFKEGYIEKDMRISALEVVDVNPTIDEVARFLGDPSDTGDTNRDLNLSQIAELTKKASVIVLQPGDQVEVFEGDQKGIQGTVHSIANEIVTIDPSPLLHPELRGAHIEIPARSLRKNFKPGDHVKVMAGQNVDETGLVIRVREEVVTFLSDLSCKEVEVFARDLRVAAEVGSGANTYGQFELYDLVQLDPQTTGVIFKIERDTFKVIDQNGNTRNVKPNQISAKKDSRHAIATDADGYEIAVNDQMKEKSIGGRTEGRRGRVLHIYRSMYAFLHSHDTTENGGVFVTNARNLVSVAPKGGKKDAGALDLTKMNPEMAGRPPVGGVAPVAGGLGQRFKRDEDIGKLCYIIKGPNKGLQGIIKDINGLLARVELHTNNKTLTVEKTKLGAKGRDGKVRPLEELARENFAQGGRPGGFGDGGANASGSNAGRLGSQSVHGGFGGATPGWGASGSRTSNPYDGSRTSYGGDGSRTSNPYADAGARTPAFDTSGAWDPSSKTTLASGYGNSNSWDASNHNASHAPTPAHKIEHNTPHDPWGPRTPAQAPTPGLDTYSKGTPGLMSVSDPRRGDRSERREDGSMSSWGNATGTTPFVAPTPTAYASRSAATAPTPNMQNMPTPGGVTPYAGAPTPTGYATAPTPVAFGNAPTPVVYGAPTPAAYAPAATPYGSVPAYAPSPAGPYNHNTNGATPYTAATPGGGLLNQSTAPLISVTHGGLPENWPQSGIEVVIIRSRDKPPFNGGRYDHQHAIVIGVLNTSRNPTYSLKALDPNVHLPPVPIEYLEPVPPRAPGEAVVILDGAYRGKRATTISRDASDWMVQLETGEQTIVDVTHLALNKTS
ncbi:uncharacterized protein MELLADRAFT_115567 [Melampsora larici-populina 98AG31]|uniref:Transcription elongation factor SPT5 n=1 Tax=Melampsora larici-populina (strain 98AG31 / pathotype 3-4-7) TaxID=747676 RepID=F4RBP8_MELLP|nr:uncharacterized protein MELLADRAFT_115567 [Melampsora larici-populina 98AG31]EGG10140.1 hypothetical protein MELLADRAFT_115567 [Melampsora larici-populina 98AG31]